MYHLDDFIVIWIKPKLLLVCALQVAMTLSTDLPDLSDRLLSRPVTVAMRSQPF